MPAITNYYYDGDDIFGERNGAGSWRAAYTYGALGLISERLNPDGQLGTAQSLWYHTNFIGSVHALTNVDQTTVQTYDYDAYGIPLTGPGTTTNPLRYVGQLGYYKPARTDGSRRPGDPDHAPSPKRAVSQARCGRGAGGVRAMARKPPDASGRALLTSPTTPAPFP